MLGRPARALARLVAVAPQPTIAHRQPRLVDAALPAAEVAESALAPPLGLVPQFPHHLAHRKAVNVHSLLVKCQNRSSGQVEVGTFLCEELLGLSFVEIEPFYLDATTNSQP